MLSSMEQSVTSRRRKRRDERGASLVEFALIVTLLSTLLLGIVIFGVLLSKRQVLTQAAAEGARYAVPVGYTFAAPDDALSAARTKTNQSLDAVGGRQCPTAGVPVNGVAMAGTGILCTFTIFDCDDPSHGQSPDPVDCIEVKVELSVNTSPALVPGSSLINPLLPNTMTGRSVVGLSGLDA